MLKIKSLIHSKLSLESNDDKSFSKGKLTNLFLNDIFDRKNSIDINLQNLDKKYEKIFEIQEMLKFLKKSNKRGIATFFNE